ncbi:MAG: SusC/RagA family TonB-linked outer membrane protein [Saprospiraceae bacterium]|nr:SusC/RagA family TonB-linked outer membrane protein [Saprospiraceae bacterium]
MAPVEKYYKYWLFLLILGASLPTNAQDTIAPPTLSHRNIQIGYGQTIRGASAKVNQHTRSATTADQLLQGTAAGIYAVQNSGQPAGEMGIHIRGFRSLLASNQPLYLIDGIPYYNETGWSSAGSVFGPAASPLAFLNPQDIEEIRVLKDAATTSLYGSRAANGVVIIRTRRTLPDSLKVSFNVSFGSQTPIGTYELANANEYAGFLNQAYNNAGLDARYDNPNAFGTGTDWQNSIYRDQAWRQNYHLGISGGGEKVKYYLSGEYLDQTGIIIGSDFQRYSFRANMDAQINDRTSLSNSLTFNRVESNTVASDAGYNESGVDVITGSRIFNPILSHQNADGSINRFHFAADNAGLSSGMLQSTFIQPNPLLLAGSTDSKSSTSRVSNNLQLKVSILDNLSLNGTIGVDALFNEEYTFIPGALFLGANQGTGSGAKLDALKFINQYFLEFNQKYSGDQKLDLVAGYSWEGWRREVLAGRSVGFDNETLRYYSLTVGQQKILNSNISEWGMQSFFGMGQYSYKDILNLTLSARADAISIFDNKWSLFPTLAFSWDLRQSSLVRSQKISSIIVHSSIGSTGNQSIPPYSRFSLLNEYNAALNGATINGISIDKIANNQLEVEKTEKYDLGIEVGFKENHLIFDLDFYRENTRNAIGLIPLLATSGFEYGVANIASISNQGLELSASTNHNVGTANASFQFFISLNKNKVESLDLQDQLISGLPFSGITDWSLTKSNYSLSTFYKRNPDQFEQSILGSAAPKMITGLFSKWDFKDLDFSISLHGAFGQKMINANNLYLQNPSGEFNVLADYLHSNIAPAFEPGKPQVLTEDLIEDASYLRVQNITIGYTIPSTLLTGSSIKKLRIYGSVENIFTLTAYSGLDPDVSHFGSLTQYQGVDLGSYPKAKMFLLGLNVDF